MILFKPGSIQDGCLAIDCGRMIIFGDNILVSHSQSTDHNYLLRAFASRYRYLKDDVISNAVRLYYRKSGRDLIFCGVRRWDNKKIETNQVKYLQLIAQQF